MRRLVLIATLALAGCASNAEIASQRCAGQQGSAFDQCVAREQARLATPPASSGGGY